MARPSQRKTALTIEFGERVKARRVELGLTQERVAHDAELSWTFYASIERGERNVGLTSLVRIARRLGVTPGQLVDGLPLPGQPRQDDASNS
jgi:transcriptional regulator with XRE-family HTH domain